MSIQIALPQAEIAAFCRRYQVRRLALFGSVLREDFREASDVDVVVEFEPDAPVSFFKMVDMQDELSALFGRPVDLHTPDSLSKYFRRKALASAQVIYERAG